jgi:hypothetical protein
MNKYTVSFKVLDHYELKDSAAQVESELYDLLLKIIAPALGVETESVTVTKARR